MKEIEIQIGMWWDVRYIGGHKLKESLLLKPGDVITVNGKVWIRCVKEVVVE